MRYVLPLVALIAVIGVFLSPKAEELGQEKAITKETVTKETIRTKLQGKNVAERAEIKSQEIAKARITGTYQDTEKTEITVELVGDVTAFKIDDQAGVEVYAKAWRNGKPLGFGKDGSVEIERFRFFNPPILVSDPNGDIVRSFTDTNGETVETRYREDAAEAIRQMVARTADKFGKTDTKIEVGKRGNTVSTFAPSLDGAVYRWGTDATWTLARDSADGLTTDDTVATQYHTSEFRTGPNRYQNTRGFYIFDTSAITDTDSIDSGYLEIEQSSDNTNVSAWGLIEGTPASESALALGDYDAMLVNSPTRLATDVTPAGTDVRNQWTLNASGLAAIDKTGKTVLVLRAARDIDNVAPGTRSYFTAKMSETTGTTDDPVLSITHSAGATPAAASYDPGIILIEEN